MWFWPVGVLNGRNFDSSGLRNVGISVLEDLDRQSFERIPLVLRTASDPTDRVRRTYDRKRLRWYFPRDDDKSSKRTRTVKYFLYFFFTNELVYDHENKSFADCWRRKTHAYASRNEVNKKFRVVTFRASLTERPRSLVKSRIFSRSTANTTRFGVKSLILCHCVL